MAEIIVRRPEYGERRYVYASTRQRILTRNGDRFSDYEHVLGLVDDMINRSKVSVAVIEGVIDDEGREEIQAFAIEHPTDGTVEFFHMRALYRDMDSRSSLSGAVARALLGDRDRVILRHWPAEHALRAILSAPYTPVWRPRTI